MFLWGSYKSACDATPSISGRNLFPISDVSRGADQGRWELSNRTVCRGIRGRRISQPSHRGRHPKHVRIARQGGVTSGEVGDPLESVTHSVWMNEQFPGASFDRAA